MLPRVNPWLGEILFKSHVKTSKVEIERPLSTLQLVWDNGLSFIVWITRNRRKHATSWWHAHVYTSMLMYLHVNFNTSVNWNTLLYVLLLSLLFQFQIKHVKSRYLSLVEFWGNFLLCVFKAHILFTTSMLTIWVLQLQSVPSFPILFCTYCHWDSWWCKIVSGDWGGVTGQKVETTWE